MFRHLGGTHVGTKNGSAVMSDDDEARARRDRVLGVAAMLTAMMIMPTVDALSKSLTPNYAPEQIAWARNAFHAVVLLPIVLHVNGFGAIRAAIGWKQAVRALCFVSMTVTYIAGLRWMELADAMATVFLFPFLVVIGSALFLGERVGAKRWIAVGFGFLGICLVVQPGFGVLNVGTPIVLFCACLTAGYILMTRKLSGTAPALVMGLLPALMGGLLMTPLTISRWTMPGLEDGLVMLSIGGLAALGHLLIVIAYSKAEASFVVPLAYTQIVTATVLGYLMFADFPDTPTWAGIAVIVASGIFIALRERRAATGASGRR